jgi:hypothetical protein
MMGGQTGKNERTRIYKNAFCHWRTPYLFFWFRKVSFGPNCHAAGWHVSDLKPLRCARVCENR